MQLSDFNYEYPEELIAQSPLTERDGSRMMVVDRSSHALSHERVSDLKKFLREGDLIVLNDSKVIPARLAAKRKSGGTISLLLLEKWDGDDRWLAIATKCKKLKAGELLDLDRNNSIRVISNRGDKIIIEFEKGRTDEMLDKFGITPLPPYIKRGEKFSSEDRERYQTIYAQSSGSAAAPTAGLHMTGGLLVELKKMGVEIAFVTLHVGIDTFTPVRSETIEDHRMHGEYFSVPRGTANLVNRAKRDSKRVIAVGTTTVRALESSFKNGRSREMTGRTNIFITPGYKFQAVDGILTNFHQPKSTLLMMISAFAGREFIMQCYREAIEKKYRLFSYGDCMLLL